MSLPTYPRSIFGSSGLGRRFGLAQMGLYIALSALLLWARQMGLRAHFSNPITFHELNKIVKFEIIESFKLRYCIIENISLQGEY